MIDISQKDFSILEEYINKTCGMSFQEIGASVLIRRTKERMTELKINIFNEYFKILSNNKTELFKLIDSITNNLTFFFRNNNQIQTFNETILPEIVKKNQNTKKIMVWSAGCSTGEEPYSIAMIINDFLGKEAKNWDIKIIASDISLKALIAAYNGIYNKKRFKDVDIAFAHKYTVENGNNYHIKKEIKKNVIFDFHNLISGSPHSNFDIIFCRNVFIYFDNYNQNKVLLDFYKKLKNDSYLILGSTETLQDYETDFITKKINDSIVYYKK